MSKGSIALLAALLTLMPLTAQADTEGQATTFTVNSFYDAEGALSVDATLRQVGGQAYLYLDDRYWDELTASERMRVSSQLGDLAELFDGSIAPQARRLWGTEANPGVDGDPHVTVLFERLMSGNGGYFEDIHNYPKSRVPKSNAREMIFVSADSIPADTAQTYLAHEFAHLISFNRRELAGLESEDRWLNEARAEYTVTATGLTEPFSGSTLQRRASSFVRAPSNSLVEWPNTSADYAIASLFAHYLVERYGAEILSDTIGSGRVGVDALDEWLAAHGRTERTEAVFADWMAAVYANNRAAGAAYGYVREGLDDVRVEPSQTTSLDVGGRPSWSMELKELQPAWLRASISSRVELPEQLWFSVNGDADVRWLGTVIADYEGTLRVTPWSATNGSATIAVPTTFNERRLRAATLAVTQGSARALDEREDTERPVLIAASLGTAPELTGPIGSPVSQPDRQPVNGDLIRHQGQSDVYVVWDGYRRYLPQGVIELYGFQDRPVYEISDEAFFRLKSSNYIRTVDDKRIYAVWPDGTKHWLNFSAELWEASGRDWGAVFIVNEHEAAFYRTGDDILR